MSKKIRDFIYLDTERVRSYLAQMEDGLQTERGLTKSHDASVSGQVEGGLSLLKAQGGGSYQFGYASNVNYQAHDEIFERLLGRLSSSGRIKNAQTTKPWNQLTFGDGDFVSTECTVKLIDMEGLKTQLTVMPKLIEKTVQFQNAQARKLGRSVKQQPTNNMSQFGELAKMLEESQILLYGDSPVIIKLFPDVTQPAKFFTCTSRNEFFREPPAAIARQYGRFFNANWKCLVLLNKRKVIEGEDYMLQEIDFANIGSVPEYVQDLFEQLMSPHKQRSDVGNATLLALYREI
ncbi:MAG: hypothetical protein RL040_904 [Bacteroidota bacterium]|jgi:hypothetical protein